MSFIPVHLSPRRCCFNRVHLWILTILVTYRHLLGLTWTEAFSGFEPRSVKWKVNVLSICQNGGRLHREKKSCQIILRNYQFTVSLTDGVNCSFRPIFNQTLCKMVTSGNQLKNLEGRHFVRASVGSIFSEFLPRWRAGDNGQLSAPGKSNSHYNRLALLPVYYY